MTNKVTYHFTYRWLFLVLHLPCLLGTVQGQIYSLSDTVEVRQILKELPTLLDSSLYDQVLLKTERGRSILLNIELRESEMMADIYHQRGVAFYYKEDYPQAISSYKKAIAIRTRLGKETTQTMGILFQNIGWNYYNLENYDQAIANFQSALEIREKIHETPHMEHYQSFQGLAYSYYDMGRIDKCIEYEIKGIVLLEKIDKPPLNSLIDAYKEVAHDLIHLGRYQQATSYFQQAISALLMQEEKNQKDLLQLYLSIAWEFTNVNAEKAKAFFNEGLKTIQVHDLADTSSLVSIFSGLASLYCNEEDYSKGNEYYELTLSFTQYLKKDSSYWASILHDFGHQLMHQEVFTKARSLLYQALSLIDATSSDDWEIQAFIYQTLGICDELEHQYELAIEQYERVIALHEQQNPSLIYFDKLEAYRLLADAYRGNADFELADSIYLDILRLADQINHKELSLTTKANTYNSIGELNVKRGKIDSTYLAKATVYFDSAFAKLDQIMRLQEFIPSSGIKVFHTSASFYRFIEKSLMSAVRINRINSQRKAYEFSNAYRAYNLTMGLKEKEAIQLAKLPDTLLSSLSNIKHRITYFEKQQQAKLKAGLAETDTTISIIRSKLFDNQLAYEQLKILIAKRFPIYYRLKYGQSKVRLNEIQEQLLTADQTLLEYFVGDSSIFIFTIQQENYQVLEVKKDSLLDQKVKQLQIGLSDYYSRPLKEQTDQLYKSTLTSYIEAAQYLYQQLIFPVRNRLDTDKLIVIPDGILGYIPFGALLSSAPPKVGNFKSYPFLEKDFQISYCYSATLLREMKEKQHKKQPQKSLVAFAPFYEGSYEKLDSTIRLEFVKLDNGEDTIIGNEVVLKKGFSPLEASGKEVKIASKLWEGDYFLNKDATEDRFNHIAGDYRIVHLSTHGMADSRMGDYSYLAFAEVPDSIENEYLYVRDLYNLQLNADLVVLSACETAAGELKRGEGIISLARGFAYAGTKSIITTLWVADDYTTRDLMKTFYIQIRKGATKDKALQVAKQNIINNRRRGHPFFWASFVAVGDMSAMQ